MTSGVAGAGENITVGVNIVGGVRIAGGAVEKTVGTVVGTGPTIPLTALTSPMNTGKPATSPGSAPMTHGATRIGSASGSVSEPEGTPVVVAKCEIGNR